MVTLRLAFLSAGYNSVVSAGVSEREIELGVSRGYIYDRNLSPLVNDSEKNVVCAVMPDGTGKNKNLYVTYESEVEAQEGPFCKNIKVLNRYADDLLCSHIIGYVDSEGRGVCGIEKSFDKILNDTAGRIGMRYTVNGHGQAIAGNGIGISDYNYNNPAGIVLTVDKTIQQIVETALARSEIETGAVVILDVETFEIAAIASIPKYDIRHLGASLNDEKLPFLNRAVTAFPVGSVFKPFVAASAIESGIDVNAEYTCTGQIQVGDIGFRCYHSNAHGEMTLQSAITKSCNTFFIHLGRNVGAENLATFCKRLGFGEETKLTGDIISSAGVFPSVKSLSSAGALANLCFGQGELLATPLQLACAYAVLANGGTYKEPYITKALVDENREEYAYYKSETTYTALKEETCEIINECLYFNMLEGTGKNGNSEFVSSAGKTATAQTGKYDENGNEKLCTWFCGFVPYENPRYSVAVLNENGSSASVDCAPVFRDIIEGLYAAGLLK